MKTFLTAAGVAGFLLLGAPGASAQGANEKGMKVFVDQKCTTCHAIAGKGNKKGALDEVGSKLTPAELREWIVNPEAMTAKTKATRKPVMKKKPLGPADVDALVALLSGLKKK